MVWPPWVAGAACAGLHLLVMADTLEKTCNFPLLVNIAFSMESAVASAFQGW
jgi:hypothetical protein